MSIKRFIDKGLFEDFKKDIKFLVERVVASGGELDFQLRDNYFNLYCRGNSLAKVTLKKKEKVYKVEINKKFVENPEESEKNYSLKKFLEKDKRFVEQGVANNKTAVFELNGDYYKITLPPSLLPSLFQVKNLNALSSNIKEINYSEEIAFEQLLMSDNLYREDLIIIDRQIKGIESRIDILALKQIKEENYSFLIIEVKLGNNKDLKGKVITQIKSYEKEIGDNFSDYKTCYEENYCQKKELGLFDYKKVLNNFSRKFVRYPDKIKIKEPVESILIIGGYPGLAIPYINDLKKAFKVVHIQNEIILSDNIIKKCDFLNINVIDLFKKYDKRKIQKIKDTWNNIGSPEKVSDLIALYDNFVKTGDSGTADIQTLMIKSEREEFFKVIMDRIDLAKDTVSLEYAIQSAKFVPGDHKLLLQYIPKIIKLIDNYKEKNHRIIYQGAWLLERMIKAYPGLKEEVEKHKIIITAEIEYKINDSLENIARNTKIFGGRVTPEMELKNFWGFVKKFIILTS